MNRRAPFAGKQAWMITGIVLLSAAAVVGCRPASEGGDGSPGREAGAVAMRAPGPGVVADDGAAVVEILEQSGGTGAYTYAVDVDGGRAVIGRGTEIVVTDVSDPAHPAELHVVPVSGEVRDLRIAGDLAYAAADTAGLMIVDLSSGSVVGGLRFEDRAYGVDVAGEHVYVAARSRGLRVVDASDPTAPREIGHLETPDEAVKVEIRGDRAYVAAWYESMRIVDVSDPAAPVELGFAPYDSYDNGALWAVAVEGDLGLLLMPEIGFRLVDVSDPDTVRIHSRHRLLRAPSGAALVGGIAFVADQDAGLRVFDLSDPANPEVVGALELPGRAMTVRVSDGRAYVAAREAGLRIVDVSMPKAPREVGFVDSGDAVVDVVSEDGTLLATGAENGVYRYDGRLVRQLDVRARRIEVAGGRILTAGPDGLRVYEEGELAGEVPGGLNGLAASEDLVAAAGPRGIHLYETNPGLREAGRYEPEWTEAIGHLHRPPPAAWDVLLRDGLAYAAFEDGIHVLDVSDPRSPDLVSRLETPERVYRLAFDGERLLAACDDGLRVVDVSEPVRPVEVAAVRTPSFATAVFAHSDTVYVGDLSGRVTAIRSSDAQPIGSWRVADRVYGLAWARNGIAVAAGAQGLRVVSLRIAPASGAPE